MKENLDPCDPQSPLVSFYDSSDQANADGVAFQSTERSAHDNRGPFVVVIDDFYEDVLSVRERALSFPFRQYHPPVPEVHGVEQAKRYRERTDVGRWSATAVVSYNGTTVEHPFHGSRYNDASVVERIEDAIHERVDADTWETMGDHWNGAFHLIERGWKNGSGNIHHHFKDGDLEGRGWSGVVYLNKQPAVRSGTSIWRHRKTGQCVADYGPFFVRNIADFELAYFVENKLNRLVLFRENVLHRAERGFGEGMDARLTQTFFFRSTC